MSKLFLDVLGNKEFVNGYQIEDSIAEKYNLKPGSICPFTGLRVELLPPQQVRSAEKTERQKIIEQQGKALGKEKQKLDSHFAQNKDNLSAFDSKISGNAADIKATTKSIHPGESHDFARGRARSGRGPVRWNRIFEREEVRMATAKKAPAKPTKAAVKSPAKTKTPVKAPVKAAVKPVKAAAKAVAKAPAKTKTPVKAPAKAAAKPAKAKAKAAAKAPAKATIKANAKAPVKAKAVAKKPAAKKPTKAKK
jgi:hypothetical protein